MIRALAFPKLYARPVAGILGIAVFVMLVSESMRLAAVDCPIRPAELPSRGCKHYDLRALRIRFYISAVILG